MNISLQNIDKVNAELSVTIEPADYTDKYAKAVKDAVKKISMPGFRPGKVPAGLVKKQYGQSILVEEINKILQEGVFNYIRDNKVNMLGEPLPAEESVNIAEGETMTFKFGIALAPEFKADVNKRDKIAYYNVEVSDEMVENQVKMYRQRGGSYQKLEEGQAYEDNDMVKGIITELGVENPVTAEDVVLLPKYFRNDEQKALFNGAKINDVVKFNPSVAYDNSEAELASLLKVAKEDVANHKGEFNLQITEITRFVEGPLNQELFDAIFPGGEVKSEEDFRARTKAAIAEQFAKDSDYKFILDVKKHMMDKVGKLEFPDEKLKKIMLINTKNDEKKVEENYAASIEQLTWHLIKEQLVAKFEVKVDDNDVKEMAKEVTKMQFAQYGMLNIPDEYLEGSVKEMLKKRETVDNLIDRCVEVKLGAAVKEAVKLDEKTVTAEEFNKMFE